MTLQDQLDARIAANQQRLPEAALAAMDADITAVTAARLVDDVPDVGDPLPSFGLPDATGTTVKSADLLARGPLVLSFYRGGWCPYCTIQFGALRQRSAEFEAADATLVAVSPMTPDASMTARERLELEFPVLSDVGNVLARELGLVHELSADVKALYDTWGFATDAVNDGHGDELPLPATFVVDAGGTIRWRFVHPDYRRRAEPDDIVAALRAL